MRRQLVPCLWARHSECTGAEVHGGGADHEVADDDADAVD